MSEEFPRRFLPEDLDAGDWDRVEPWLQSLLERPIADAAQLEAWLLDVSELESALAEERSRRYIAMTRDTTNADAEAAYLEHVEHFMPRLKPCLHRLNVRFVESPYRDELDPVRYGVLDRNIVAEVDLFREDNIPLQTEASILSQRYQKSIGAMQVEFRGEERTMPQMDKFLESTDRDLREEAWRAAWERRLRDHEPIDEIFDELVGIRHRIARNADCADYRDYAFRSFGRFDYTPHDCERFHDAVETCVMPVLRDLGRQRCRAMGLEALRPWDTTVDPLGRPPLEPFDDVDALVAGVHRIFSRLEPELAGQFEEMHRRGELDLDSRKGKAPGGYLSTLEEVRRPFIFMNAAGVHRDVQTLLHECGHAFHSLAARHEPLVEYRSAPIEFAEVASMTMELFADDLFDEFYEAADADRAKRKHLEGILVLLPWIARIDAFQHWIYTHPDHDRESRTQAWLALGERFEPDLDWTGLEEQKASQWQRQLHLFCYPFYYIEYGIAQLGALQIWRRFQEDPAAALASYRSALTLGGSRPLPDLFEAAGARLAFDETMIGPLMEALGEELDSLPA